MMDIEKIQKDVEALERAERHLRSDLLYAIGDAVRNAKSTLNHEQPLSGATAMTPAMTRLFLKGLRCTSIYALAMQFNDQLPESFDFATKPSQEKGDWMLVWTPRDAT